MLRLLLLETRSAFAERLAAALSCCDHTLCQREVFEAWEQVAPSRATSGCDAIVIDLRQEHRDPRSFCRRASACVQDRPIIAVTAVDNVDLAIRLVEVGADEVCLRSECDTDYLLRRIRVAEARFHTRAIWQQVAASAGHTQVSSSGLPLTLQRQRGAEEFDLLSDEGPEVHVLCIDPTREMQPQTTLIQTGGFDLPADIHCVPGMREAIRQLNESEWEVVVLRLPDTSPAALEAITILRSCAPDAHLFVNAAQAEESFLVDAIQHGADDFLECSRDLSPTLIRAIRAAFARKWRGVRGREVTDEPDVAASAPRSAPHGREYLDRNPRYFVTRSAVVLPINADSTPHAFFRAEGFTVDISSSGIRFQIRSLADLPSERLLVGVEGQDGVLSFATVRVRHWTRRAGQLQVGAQFVDADQELFCEANLMPTLRSATHRYATGLPAETLRKWAEAGVLQPLVFDRILVCPKCEALPTFRHGCRSCGSIHIVNQPVILHADCAYLGTESEFERGGRMICPKCGQEDDGSGNQFARHLGPCRCLDCHWSDADTEVVGQCLGCRWHFPLEQALERELTRYQVRRLDPASFLGA